MTVYIWPIPQAAYQITAIYSKIYPNITVDNINSVVMLPDSTLTTLEKGVYAYLREQIGDPVAPALLEEYKSQIGIQAQRNKHTYKRRNYNIFRVRPRRGDRKL